MTTLHTRVKIAVLLISVGLCLFEFVLHRQSAVFRGLEAELLSLRWILPLYLVAWCATILFLTFDLSNVPLIGLLAVASAAYFIGGAEYWRESDALALLASVTLGKSTFMLGRDEQGNDVAHVTRRSPLVTFLFGLVLLVAFTSWWHLDMTDNFYDGPRWMGLGYNPNDYGMLMGAGLVLTIGLLAQRQKEKGERKRFLPVVFLIAAGMMAVGLLFSYSRGAWIGTAIALLYLAKVYRKFKWRWLLPPFLLVAAVVVLFWNTPRTAPWYIQRLDLSRGSVQHRLAAWKAGFEIMWDHPFGVGWNKTVETYQKNYSPPEDGAAAITTNDYLMLGTQLGWPGLVCFMAYCALCFRRRRLPNGGRVADLECADTSALWNGATRRVEKSGDTAPQSKISAACRAGALAMLVGFWFDGGLFKLATASVFWILLELGAESRQKEKFEFGNPKSKMDRSLVTSAPTKQE